MTSQYITFVERLVGIYPYKQDNEWQFRIRTAVYYRLLHSKTVQYLYKVFHREHPAG